MRYTKYILIIAIALMSPVRAYQYLPVTNYDLIGPGMGIHKPNNVGTTIVDIYSGSGTASLNLYKNIDGSSSGTLYDFDTGKSTNVKIDVYGNVHTNSGIGF